MQLVLASQSPRRLEILERAGFHPVVRVSGVPEQRSPDESARHYVQRLARAKAQAVVREPGEVVLGADTVVVLDSHILEKPSDSQDASRMLALLSGQTHRVITGICLRHDKATLTDAAETDVRFVDLTPQDIRDYVASGEPMDKAGAYAIQGLASRFIDRIDGCYFNVVGLPISLIHRHLRPLFL